MHRQREEIGMALRWLTPVELSKVSGWSERTIRHYAAQGRVKTRREGKAWLIEPKSAISAGIKIPEDFFKTLGDDEPEKEINKSTLNHQDAKSSQGKNEQTSEPAKEESAEKKYKKLVDLGVYKELCLLFKNECMGVAPEVADTLRRSLHFIALGFYEFHRERKAEWFKKSRECLVASIVMDDLGSAEASKWRLTVEDSIIPGVIGLIRKQEKKYGAGNSSQNSTRQSRVARKT